VTENTIDGGVKSPVNAYSNSTTATTRNMNGSDVNRFMNASEFQPNSRIA
jgi:hypothetical protein